MYIYVRIKVKAGTLLCNIVCSSPPVHYTAKHWDEMAVPCNAVDRNDFGIWMVHARGWSDYEHAGSGVAPLKRGQPLNICEWMPNLDGIVLRKREYCMNMCDTKSYAFISLICSVYSNELINAHLGVKFHPWLHWSRLYAPAQSQGVGLLLDGVGVQQLAGMHE